MITNTKDYEELRHLIWYHNRLYYTDHSPEISDEEYTRFCKILASPSRERQTSG